MVLNLYMFSCVCVHIYIAYYTYLCSEDENRVIIFLHNFFTTSIFRHVWPSVFPRELGPEFPQQQKPEVLLLRPLSMFIQDMGLGKPSATGNPKGIDGSILAVIFPGEPSLS